MSLTMAPVASNGVAFGFGGAATLSDAGGMIQTSDGTFGSATFFSAVTPGCSGSSSARRFEIRRLQARRIGARITRGLQPLRLIGLQAGGGAWHPGARGRVVAAEIFVEIGDAAIGAHHLLDARLRFGAIKTLRECRMGRATGMPPERALASAWRGSFGGVRMKREYQTSIDTTPARASSRILPSRARDCRGRPRGVTGRSRARARRESSGRRWSGSIARFP